MTINSPSLQKSLRAAELVQWVMWLSMIGSIVILVVVAHQTADGGASTATDLGGMRTFFPVLAAGLLLASFLIGHWGKSEKAIALSVRGDARLVVDPPPEIQTSESERRVMSAVEKGIVPFVLALALGEAVTILGFVLARSSGKPDEMYFYAAASLIMTLLNTPKVRKIAEKADELLVKGGTRARPMRDFGRRE